jgi:hypothetical protein
MLSSKLRHMGSRETSMKRQSWSSVRVSSFRQSQCKASRCLKVQSSSKEESSSYPSYFLLSPSELLIHDYFFLGDQGSLISCPQSRTDRPRAMNNMPRYRYTHTISTLFIHPMIPYTTRFFSFYESRIWVISFGMGCTMVADEVLSIRESNEYS